MATVEACAHCGVRVVFGADGRCPQCRVSRDAPVTEAHLARAEAIREADARPGRLEAEVEQTRRQDVRADLLVGVVALATGVGLTAASFSRGGSLLWYGLILVGVGSLIRAAIRSR